jgi:EAL domain-containing protein (putative c-di-GMP-specific phosphodiesterase class I)/ActR/RegA family two-component response regulator
VLTVLVADDDRRFRCALTQFLRASAVIEHTASAGDAEEAAEIASTLQPDVALVDVNVPGDGARAVLGILSGSPKTRVVALSAADACTSPLTILRAGACSYVVKGASPHDILDVVVRAARGECFFSAEVARGVMHELTGRLGHRGIDDRDVRRREAQIAAVIREGRITPVFQPIVELSSRYTVGFEALARFDAEPRNSPQWWFSDAEAFGMRVELELAAAEAALQQFRIYGGPGFLSLNASPLALSSLGRLVSEMGDQVVIEITEHAAIDDYDLIARTIGRLRDDGVRFAIDDAGAGFASLRHVLELEPEFVKLDVSLTRGIDRDARRRALAYGLNAFADELDITIVAEGVERQAELEALRELGVALGQGNFVGAPGRLPG